MADIEIVGTFEIRSGELVVKGRNKWTRFFMSSLMQSIYNPYRKYGDNMGFRPRGFGYGATSRVGTDTIVETTSGMTDLVDKIDIEPSSVLRRLWKDPADNLYVAEYVFTWDSGVLPDTEIGELGVYLNLSDDSWESPLVNANTVPGGLTPSPYSGAGNRLGARIASADDAFSPFYLYGSVEPLTFIWRFQVIIL